MTETQRKGWLAGLGGVAGLASILGLLAFWPQAQPLADWLLSKLVDLAVIARREQVHAVLLAVSAATVMTVGLPYLRAWNEFTPDKTRARLRWYACGTAFAVAWGLVPTRVGFVYALLTGLSGAQIGMAALRVIKRLLPAATTPASLKPGNGDAPAP